MLQKLIDSAAQVYLTNEASDDDPYLPTDADFAWSWAVEESKMSFDQLIEVYGEIYERFGDNIGNLDVDSGPLTHFLQSGLVGLGGDSPIVKAVIEAIEATGINYAEHFAERKASVHARDLAENPA